MNLRDKVIVVTGAASGIGEACARLFAHEGAKVVLGDRDGVRGKHVAAAIESQQQQPEEAVAGSEDVL